MQRRIRFAGGSDGPEILPRSSQSGGRSSRSDKSGLIKSVLMVAALVGTVFFITRITRNLDHSDLASTGEGEGLEDFMLTHDQHHDPHQFRTARERDHDHAHHLQQHDTHAHQLHDSATAVDIDGRERHLSEFAGKVTLVVNVASQCGFTDANYKGLQEAYNKYHKFGFEVLAFPSNEFGNQEPGSNADIKSFCADRYHTTFPIFSKVQVNGPSAHPVFQYLRRELPADQGGGGGVAAGKDIGWNFYKFLVGRDGKPVKLFHQQWQQAVVEHAVYEMLVDPQYVLDSGMHHG
ncbi:hypothetical protein OEZ86_002485 [Tetradesmus obliquus]|nr:hypothetical protein OEZ86_002485 [Tetradesmus obliquus]